MKKSTLVKKLSVYLFFATAVIYFVYALGFFTNFVFVRAANQKLYNDMQVFNKQIFSHTLTLLLYSGLFIAVENHKRIRFGISNIVVSVLAIANSAFIGIYLLTNSLDFSKRFYSLTLEEMETIKGFDEHFKFTTNVFNFGIAIAIAILVLAAVHTTILVMSFVKKDLKNRGVRNGY